jgi:CheY-like chemotaxis protein
MTIAFDILIVEDEPVVIEAAKKILEPEGFKIDICVDADDASTKLTEHGYNLILSDLMLPDTSGLEFARQVKLTYRDLPFVMITGYATPENTLESFKIGVFDFIAKPFDIEELLAVVFRSINYRRQIEVKTTDRKTDRLTMRTGPDEKFYFLGEHSWTTVDADGSAKVGVGLTFPNLIGDIQSFDSPIIDENINQGNVCTRIINNQEHVHKVYAPISGRVLEINNDLAQNPDLLNTAPFSEGWLIRLLPLDLQNDLEHLTPH